MIEIRDLSITYPGGFIGLRRTSLTIKPGEFTVLLGPSGAGKSTLLRSLNGLATATTGSISVAGHGPMTSALAWRHHRRRTGMVFQQHQLIGRVTVLANVLMGRLGHHGTVRSLFPLPVADRQIALECLERVGILDRALDRVDQLSGGQQQRVGIARAMAQLPDVVLADEPVASLDPATAVAVLELLHQICKTDELTAVVSLHHVPFARRFADRIVGLAGGEVAFDCRPADLSDFDLDRLYRRSYPTRSTSAELTLAQFRNSRCTEEVS